MIDTARVLCGQRALLEKGHDVHHLVFSGKVLDIPEELVSGNAGQRVFDPVIVSMAGRWQDEYQALTPQSRS
jgi:hypothetical protein